MREPLARTLSGFYTMTGRQDNLEPMKSHFLCNKGSLVSTLLHNESFTFEDYAHLPDSERAQCMRGTSNRHVEYLAGDQPYNRRLEVAKKRLARMAWVGLTEEFDKSMELLSYTFGLRLQHYAPVFNSNKYAKKLSPQAKTALLELNKLDVELYEFASKLFRERYAAMLADRGFSTDPSDSEPYFLCDPRTRCWDKTQPGDPWTMGENPLKKPLGYLKANMLCAPRRGCTKGAKLEDFYKPRNPAKVKSKAGVGVSRGGDATANPQSVAGAGAGAGGSGSGSGRGSDRTNAEDAAATAEDDEGEAEDDEQQQRTLPPTQPSSEPDSGACLPSFFIIGARKGGTTSLYQYISSHPKVRGVRLDKGAQGGEMFFFTQYMDELRTMSDSALRDRYNGAFKAEFARLYPGRAPFDPSVEVTGESSVGMGPACPVPGMLTNSCGRENIKLIYLLRDPVARAVSQYLMRNRLGTESTAVVDALRRDLTEFHARFDGGDLPAWLNRRTSAGSLDDEDKIPCLFDLDYKNSIWSGLYAVHVARWRKHLGPGFRDSQMLVMLSEEFFADPATSLRKVLEFLNLDESAINVDEVVKAQYNSATKEQKKLIDGAQGPALPSGLSRKLHDTFRPFNDLLATALHLNISMWPDVH